MSVSVVMNKATPDTLLKHNAMQGLLVLNKSGDCGSCWFRIICFTGTLDRGAKQSLLTHDWRIDVASDW